MKSCKRYFLVFFVCVLLSGLFSLSANAESVDTSNIKLNIYSYEANNGWSFGQLNLYSGSTVNDYLDSSYYNENILQKTITSNNNLTFRNRLTFVNTENGVMFEEGKNYTFSVDNLILKFGASDGTFAYDLQHSLLSITHYKFVYNDGSESSNIRTGYDLTVNPATDTVSISIKFTPELPVYKIIVYTQSTITPTNYVGKQTHFCMAYGIDFNATSKWEVKIDEQSEEAGLLSGIISWVKTISEDVSSGFANLVKGITDLPSKIWQYISDGLMSLFVPDEEYMVTYKDKWDSLLEDRFGAIYQVGSIITDFWGDIKASDKTNTIKIPVVDLSSTGIPFSFGGYDVTIVPEKFNTIVEILKKIISITCTFLFINGLRKRYDEVMGVEQ